MQDFEPLLLKQLYIPPAESHKGQNGKVLIVAGSHLFHAASLWALDVASRIVDMVFYASVPENNALVERAKSEFRNGIVVKRENLDSYIKEADCVLIGPGMVRDEAIKKNLSSIQIDDINFINSITNEGEQTYLLTQFILTHYPEKRYVIDAGALQMMNPDWLLRLKETPILTPHRNEFTQCFGIELPLEDPDISFELLRQHAKRYNCVILLKGKNDIVCSTTEAIRIKGGNAGMTKGGTGDVLASLIACFYTKNDPVLSAAAGSYINKKAAEVLHETVGVFFNASDLAAQVPLTLKKFIPS